MFPKYALVRFAIPAFVASAYLACVSSTLYKSATVHAPAREPGCAFDVVGSHPGPGFVEVGQVAVEGPADQVVHAYRDPQAFANEVRAGVCAAGGDVLMTEVNGAGAIVHAIVFHRVDQAESGGSQPAGPAPSLGTCEPICSPGFACNAGSGMPLCNPACTGAETCGNDRLCHAGG